MPNPCKSAPIELTLPADPKLMLIIRLTVAGVVARAGVTVDRMDDIKMAVEEACSCLLDQENAPDKLHLQFECHENAMDIRICALSKDDPVGNVDDAELDVMRCILDSLADHTEFDVQNGWIASIRMRAALVQ